MPVHRSVPAFEKDEKIDGSGFEKKGETVCRHGITWL